MDALFAQEHQLDVCLSYLHERQEVLRREIRVIEAARAVAFDELAEITLALEQATRIA
jgi:hypothetical protein